MAATQVEEVFSDPLLPAPLIYGQFFHVSKPTFYRIALLPDFPKPVVFGERTRRWRKSEILAYIAAKTVAA